MGASAPADLSRRRIIRTALLGGAAVAAGVGLVGCGDSAGVVAASAAGAGGATAGAGDRILVAYFSRAGENYWYGGRRTLQIGNTELLVQTIRGLIACDVYRIEASDPYPQDYQATVDRNVREQQADARPAIAGALPDLAAYNAVLVGSPIWNVRPPMIMSTFLEAVNLTGTALWPFTTHAMSGLGTATRDYARLAPAAVLGDGLAVRGEEVPAAASDVRRWLQTAQLLPI